MAEGPAKLLLEDGMGALPNTEEDLNQKSRRPRHQRLLAEIFLVCLLDSTCAGRYIGSNNNNKQQSRRRVTSLCLRSRSNSALPPPHWQRGLHSPYPHDCFPPPPLPLRPC